MNKAIWPAIFAIAAMGFVVASEMEYQEAKDAENEYCAMVKLHNSSHGTNGYPDFKNVFNKQCKGE